MIKPVARAWAALTLWVSASFATAAAISDAGVVDARAGREKIVLTVRAAGPVDVFELAPFETLEPSRAPLARVASRWRKTISVPRFDGARDRIYSGFAAAANGAAVGETRFVTDWNKVSKNTEPYPPSPSKKGLQVQMVDDAIALGVKHAALNWSLGPMIRLQPGTNDLVWQMDGREFYFHRSYVEAMDRKVKTLSDAGMNVTLILLYYKSADDALNRVMLHPKYDDACPEKLSAFNTSTPEGLAWFKACIEFLAARYSDPAQACGRVANYIVGNEVNSHWWWSNMGRVSMEEFAEDYLRAVRVCHTAVRKFSSSARVFVSLEHHWNSRFSPDEQQSFPARAFIDYFAARARRHGDFDWHVAFHPYPENLFECRTWNDKSALPGFDTPRITFKNIEVLPKYLQQPELLYRGKPRRIILSEQGFHSPPGEEGEIWQAAAYCYAFYKVARLEGIDSFILHRHVDHGREYGLNLGLWRRNLESASPAEPAGKKPIYEVFRLADTPEWKRAFEFALPIVGIGSWSELDPARR